MLKKHILSKYGSKYNIQKMEMFSVNDDGRTTLETRTVEISDTDEKIVSRTKQAKKKEDSDVYMVLGSTELTKSIELSDSDERVERENNFSNTRAITALTETIEVSDPDEYVCNASTQTTFTVETSDPDEFYS